MLASGLGTVWQSSGWYDVGAKVTITMTANFGQKFKSWTGKGTGSYSGTKSLTTMTMNSAIT